MNVLVGASLNWRQTWPLMSANFVLMQNFTGKNKENLYINAPKPVKSPLPNLQGYVLTLNGDNMAGAQADFGSLSLLHAVILVLCLVVVVLCLPELLCLCHTHTPVVIPKV